MKTMEILCPPGIDESDLSVYESNLLAIWRVIPEGKTVGGRDTHDEDGNLVIWPYRGRHIVDGFGNTICEFIHEERHAHLLAAAPRLLAALERCVEQIGQMREMFDDEDGAIQTALDDANDAIALAAGEKAWAG